MATVAATIGSAFILSGTNYLFSLLGNYGEEGKRHNLEMEKITEVRDEYNKQERQRLNFINTTLRDQHHAEKTFSDVEEAMEEYHRVTGKQLPPLRKPVLSYNPSRQYKDEQIAFTIGGMALLGFLAYKYM